MVMDERRWMDVSGWKSMDGSRGRKFVDGSPMDGNLWTEVQRMEICGWKSDECQTKVGDGNAMDGAA
jgi:hypothetical protein